MADGTNQAKEFLDELLTSDAPIAKEVQFEDRKGTVYFRRLSAGERSTMLRGQKIETRKGEKATIVIDLGENVRTRQLMVLYSVCRADGTRHFKRIEDVANTDSKKIDALYKVAAEINKEDDVEEGAEDSLEKT